MRRSGSYDELSLVDHLASELGVERRRPIRRVQHQVSGSSISALRWGEEDPTLVLLHGGSLNAHSWDALLLLLDVPALAIDLPGHGSSSWFPEPLYTPAAVAAAVAPAIAELAPAAAAVVGHSLGGLAALALAAGHPDHVRRLVVVDATPGSTPDRSRDILELVRTSEFPSLEAVVDHVAGSQPRRTRASLRRSVLHNARARPDGRWTWRHDTRVHPTQDRWEVMFRELPRGWAHVAAVRCPTLLVRGARSPIVLDDDVTRYRELLPGLRVVLIPDAGHNIQGQQPASLGHAIMSFLEGTGWRVDEVAP